MIEPKNLAEEDRVLAKMLTMPPDPKSAPKAKAKAKKKLAKKPPKK